MHHPREYLCIVEDQAFLPSYELAPTPPLPPSPARPQVVSLSSSYVSPIELSDERGGGVRRGCKVPNHTTAKSLVLCNTFNTLWTTVNSMAPL
jgi:hypothetical protein